MCTSFYKRFLQSPTRACETTLLHCKLSFPSLSSTVCSFTGILTSFTRRVQCYTYKYADYDIIGTYVVRIHCLENADFGTHRGTRAAFHKHCVVCSHCRVDEVPGTIRDLRNEFEALKNDFRVPELKETKLRKQSILLRESAQT